MNTKHILHLVTFVLTFAVSVTVAGAVKSFQGLSSAERITEVISQDINNGFNRRQVSYNRSSFDLAQRTNSYVSDSEGLDVSGLPADFQNAWQKHMKAWRTHADFLNEVKGSSNFDADYNTISIRQIDEINRTWYEVIRVAQSHDAAIPRGAFD